MIFRCQNLQLQQSVFRLEVDFEAGGQVVGIFGNSGAGKTTLLELVTGLRKPQAGRIIIDDRVLTDTFAQVFLSPEERGIGYIPQDLALFPHMTVRKNLLYGKKAATTNTDISLDHVVSVLEIESLLDRAIPALSGGQQQRVAFARALLSSPQLLVMDEPLASLDSELKLRIIPYLKRIRDAFRIPMLYVSHAPDEVVELCDRVIVLRDGKCVRVAAPAELFEPSASMKLRPGIYDSAR